MSYYDTYLSPFPPLHKEEREAYSSSVSEWVRSKDIFCQKLNAGYCVLRNFFKEEKKLGSFEQKTQEVESFFLIRQRGGGGGGENFYLVRRISSSFGS